RRLSTPRAGVATWRRGRRAWILFPPPPRGAVTRERSPQFSRVVGVRGRGGRAARLPRLRSAHIERVGLQLYTVRHEMEKDVEGTIARVAASGYKEVEFAGYFKKTPAEIRAMLDRNGLTAPSAHVSAAAPDAWHEALDAAHVIGHQYVVVPWIPVEQRTGIDGYKKIAAHFNQAAEQARAAGLQFAYHNHDFEFAAVDGKLPYDVLLAETDPKLVRM